MKISRIVQKRIRVCVLFDNDEFIYLRYDTVLKFGLKKNDEVDEKLLMNMKAEDDRLQIKELSFGLLTRRMHSAFEIKRKLLLKKFPIERINEVISDLLDRNYLNDAVFADKYAHEKLKNAKTGLIKIKAELFNKGVDKKIIEQALSQFENSEELLKNALLLARKKLKSSVFVKLTPLKKKEKLFRFLISKGYSSDIAKSVMNKFHLDDDSDSSFD
jgi:regulatory protein